jgi:hypothetical protein
MRVPDRQKQRWEYLKRKAIAQSKIQGASLLALCLLIAAAICGLLACGGLIFAYFLMDGVVLSFAIVFTMLTVITGLACRSAYQFIEKASEEEMQIPYAPPVRPDTLPAEEVLVRGAQEPAREQSGMLLRAADENVEVPIEQLLRAAAEETQH